MAHEVKLTIDGMLLNWLKEAGDAVKAGELIAELEADKATVEVEAPADGVIVELRAQVGDELTEGTVIALIGEAGEAGQEKPAAEEKPAARKEEAAEERKEEAVKQEETAAAKSNGRGASVTEEGRIRASPLARNVAAERGIDLSQVPGSGPGGRIVRADVEGFKPGEKAPSPAEAAPAAAAGRATWGELPQGEDVEIIEVSRMRRAIADNTGLSKQQVPHFYVTIDVDMEPLLALRKELNTSLEDEGVKISVNDMIVKAAALALRKFPNLNSHFYGDKIVRHKRINIGMAVALPNNGLLNVVSKDADRTSLSVMAVQNKEMIDRARENKPRGADLKGSTFTISNLGPYGVLDFSAIIVPPEAAILAVSTAQRVPVVKEDGSIGVGNIMRATISVDHRVSDGAEGAQFMFYLKELLENPMRLLV